MDLCTAENWTADSSLASVTLAALETARGQGDFQMLKHDFNQECHLLEPQVCAVFLRWSDL